MTEINDLISRINNQNCQESKNDEVQRLIKDKSLPINARWDLYTKAVDANYLKDIDSCYFVPVLLNKENFTLYDNAYVDKYQTYDYTHLIGDSILTKYMTNTLSKEEFERFSALREEILKDGHSAWVNDW